MASKLITSRLVSSVSASSTRRVALNRFTTLTRRLLPHQPQPQPHTPFPFLATQTQTRPTTTTSSINTKLYGEGSSIDTTRTHLLPEFSLANHLIVVSGGAQGLGLSLSEALIEAGATVHILDLQPEPTTSEYNRIASLSLSLNAIPLTYHRVDVTHRIAVDQTFVEIAESSASGGIDGVVAAAGVQFVCDALEYDSAEFDRMLRVNVTGAFNCARAGAERMIARDEKEGERRGGSVVMVGSMSGSVANKGLICPAYNASKAAVIQLGRNLAAEWGKYGIRVNTLSPGYIRTEMLTSLFEKLPGMEERWEGENMLGRLSEKEEYRGAAVFLLSQASIFMTAGDLKIDGGHTAW